MAKSRQKKLDKMDRIELSKEKPKPTFNFKTGRASGKVIFETKDLVIGYDSPLTKPLNISMERQIGYFEQEGASGNKNTCIEEYWKEFPSYTQYEVRAALAKCGLTTKHIESMVMVLSGGEAAKVRLAKLINRETNILILDEPTNHLDVEAKDELKRALQEYKGTILLVCHEPEFYKDVVTDIWNCEDWTTKIV